MKQSPSEEGKERLKNIPPTWGEIKELYQQIAELEFKLKELEKGDQEELAKAWQEGYEARIEYDELADEYYRTESLIPEPQEPINPYLNK